MPVRFLIILLCLSPGVLLAKQENKLELGENDLELFEFLALFEQNDVIFIDSEIEDKTTTDKQMNQKVNMSESDE